MREHDAMNEIKSRQTRCDMGWTISENKFWNNYNTDSDCESNRLHLPSDCIDVLWSHSILRSNDKVSGYWLLWGP
jgi:hypothetical protein